MIKDSSTGLMYVWIIIIVGNGIHLLVGCVTGICIYRDENRSYESYPAREEAYHYNEPYKKRDDEYLSDSLKFEEGGEQED